MSVRKKTLVIILATFALLVIAIFSISSVIIAGSYDNQEAQQVREDVRRAQNAIFDEISILDSVCRDLSRRDDTYSFIQVYDEQYVISVMHDYFFSDFDINFALFVNETSKLVYGKGFDTGSRQETPLKPSLNESILTDLFPLYGPDDRGGISGLVMTPESPAIIASYPVLTSQNNGPSQGTLIIGHYLDSSRIKEIADSAYLYHLNIYKYGDNNIAQDLNEATSLLNAGLPIVVTPTNNDYVAGYIILKDIKGTPGLILKVDEPRDMHDRGVSTSHYLTYTVIAVGLIFITIIMVLMENQVLSRLTFLRRSVSKIDLSQGENERIVIPGKDEFADLGNTINEMVVRLESSITSLRQSEERHRNVLENIEEGYFELNEEGQFTIVNDALCQSLGYTKGILRGTYFWNYVCKNCTVDFKELSLQIKRTGLPAKWISWQAQGKNNTECYIETSIYPIFGKKQEVVGYRGIARDVTERKKHEKQLLVTSKLASIGELASGVAHELNNPLTSVIGYAQLLSSNRDVPGDVKSDLDKICRESQRAAKIVQNLLSFARQRKPDKNAQSVNDLVTKTLELRAYEHKTSNITVKTELGDNLPAVIADYYQIQQVLLNLVINAEHAIAETQHKGEITIVTAAIPEFIRIAVKDNGGGISPENIDRIFDPFFTTKDVNKGTGLGLSICHGIISEHDGRIYVESTKGQGAAFYLELPITDLKAAGPGNETSSAIKVRPEKPGFKGTVLIIDDEPGICEVIQRNLNSMGYKTGAAPDGKTGLEEIGRNGYDACILDMKMPGMSGREVYENIVKYHPTYTDKVIFLTGDTITSSTQHFLKSTGRPFLNKPFDYQELLQKIEKCLKDHKKNSTKEVA
jgi:PAS domain S-box-containing protein